LPTAEVYGGQELQRRSMESSQRAFGGTGAHVRDRHALRRDLQGDKVHPAGGVICLNAKVAMLPLHPIVQDRTALADSMLSPASNSIHLYAESLTQ